MNRPDALQPISFKSDKLLSGQSGAILPLSLLARIKDELEFKTSIRPGQEIPLLIPTREQCNLPSGIQDRPWHAIYY